MVQVVPVTPGSEQEPPGPEPALTGPGAATGGVSGRAALRGAGLGSLTVVVTAAGALSYRAFDNKLLGPEDGDPFEAWRNWRDGSGTSALVAAAVLAASPHNTQPWLFRATSDRVDVYADAARRLGSPDPFGREMHVGLGCALENLALAAQAYGYDPHVTVLPDPTDPLLVARVQLASGPSRPSDTAQSDGRNGQNLPVAEGNQAALFEAIGDRRTNRGPYRDRAVPEGVLAELAGLADGDGLASVAWFSAPETKRELGEMMIAAAQAIVADDQQSRDNFAWLRVDADAVARHRDGLTLDVQGLPRVTTAIAKFLPATSRASGDRFWVKQTRTVHTRTAAAYGVILVPDPQDPAQRLTGGRLLQRVQLAVTARGLAMQHMNQITERIDRDRDLGRQSQFAPPLAALVARSDQQALATFRIGYPVRPGRLSPRRTVAAVTL